MENWREKIEKDIKENDIVLYMKGTKEAPRCGFSFKAVKIFEQIGLPFKTEDMGANRDLWDALKEMNNWPTSPQIFVKGEFIGGCDILVEMFQNGDLHKMLGVEPVSPQV